MRAFNTAAHAALIAAGYVHERHDADWQDTGDAENGPELSGGPAFDLYTDADSVVMISESGETAFEWRDLEAERVVEEMAEQTRAYHAQSKRLGIG